MPWLPSALALLVVALPANLAGGAHPPSAVQSAPDGARRDCERLNDSGTYADALPFCRAAAALLRGAGTPDNGDLGRVLTSLGLALEMTGDRNAAEASYREALALYRGLGQPAQEALVLSNLAALAIGGGDYGAALAWLAEEEAVTRRALAAGDDSWAPAELEYVQMNRSVALEQLGAYTEALAQIRPLANRSLVEGAGGPATSESAALTVNLAVLYRNLGDPRRALTLLDRARIVYEAWATARRSPTCTSTGGSSFSSICASRRPRRRALARALELAARERRSQRGDAHALRAGRSPAERRPPRRGALRLRARARCGHCVRRRGRPLGGPGRIGARRPRGGRPRRRAPPTCAPRSPRSKRPAKVSAIQRCAVACLRISARSTPPPSTFWPNVA